jgi:hypothetical protein
MNITYLLRFKSSKKGLMMIAVKTYQVVLKRMKTKSWITVKIIANNLKQAKEEAQRQLPDWEVSIVAKE